MAKAITIIGWVLIGFGLAGVFTPHTIFLAGLFKTLLPTLDILSHSIFEISSGISIVIGLILTSIGRMK